MNEVSWNPPIAILTKCNTDGAAKGAPGVIACGGILEIGVQPLWVFASNIWYFLFSPVELVGAIVIEIAYKNSWFNCGWYAIHL